MRGRTYQALRETQYQVEASAGRQPALNEALEPEVASPPERIPGPDDPIAPEHWTSGGGMVQQQASAIEYLEHRQEVRQERLAAQSDAANELTSEDRELLDAARATEAQAIREQELSQSHFPEPSGP